jgi:hypothetical protein
MMAGANPAAVQRILRHHDPRITTEVYGHLAPDYLRGEIDRLRFDVSVVPAPAPVAEPIKAAVNAPLGPMVVQDPPVWAIGGPSAGRGSSENPETFVSAPQRIRTSDLRLRSQGRGVSSG